MIWPRNRQKVLQSHWVTGEPKIPAMRPLQPIIPVQSPPRFDEIISPIKLQHLKAHGRSLICIEKCVQLMKAFKRLP
jgi:hypothetical protein